MADNGQIGPHRPLIRIENLEPLAREARHRRKLDTNTALINQMIERDQCIRDGVAKLQGALLGECCTCMNLEGSEMPWDDHHRSCAVYLHGLASQVLDLLDGVEDG